MRRAPTEAEQAALERLRAIPESERYHEILDGALVKKPSAGFAHGHAQAKLGATLLRAGSAGMWLGLEVEVQLGGEVFYAQPDLAGWSRARLPKIPRTAPIHVAPDWIGEIVSLSDPERDTVLKRRGYAEAGVPFFWLVELEPRALTALVLQDGSYRVDRVAHPGDCVRLRPFEDIELLVELLFLPARFTRGEP